MKLDRMIGILVVLLQRDRVTAPELAGKFEVSRRTINRDIDALCRAGIPVVTSQGAGGGISIMEGFRVDRSLLTGEDMRAILAGLRSLDSVSGTNRYALLMEKLSPGSADVLPADSRMLIDLASWYGRALSEKIGQIHEAIDSARVIEFHYYAPGGESERAVEPCYLVFRWSSWYVWGWCRAKGDWRLFKLNRMTNLKVSGPFERRPAPLPVFSSGQVVPQRWQVKALVLPEFKWRLIEEYGEGCYVEQSDGQLLFEQGFSDRSQLISWMLSFGDGAELLEPAEMRAKLRRVGEYLTNIYGLEGGR